MHIDGSEHRVAKEFEAGDDLLIAHGTVFVVLQRDLSVAIGVDLFEKVFNEFLRVLILFARECDEGSLFKRCHETEERLDDPRQSFLGDESGLVDIVHLECDCDWVVGGQTLDFHMIEMKA